MPARPQKKVQPGSGYWGTGDDIKPKREKPDKAKLRKEKLDKKQKDKEQKLKDK